MSYKGWVPSLGILPAPRRDRPGRPTAMLLAHLVYGVALAELVHTLAPAQSRPRALPPGAQALHSPRPMNPENPSLWLATSERPRYAPLTVDLEVDVAIVGGGITGLTAALLLRRAGKSVALLESRRIGGGVTGYTTAHLTQAVDARYATLASRFGAQAARDVATSTGAAIDRIEQLADELGIACDFARVPGYLYSEQEADLRALHEEYEAARAAGVVVTMTRAAPLPFPAPVAVKLENQAQMHAGKYVAGLAAAAAQLGCAIFEETHVAEIHEGPRCTLVAAGGKVTAGAVISATDSPLTRVFVQTKVHSSRSYAVAFQPDAPLARALFWDTADPYHYIRTADAGDAAGPPFVIVGGEDHKTGQNHDTEKCYERLVAYARERFRFDRIAYRWSAQVMEPIDGLPYIGPTPHAANLFVATGYSGTGMTFGTLAAMILTDRITGRASAWADLYAATRVKVSTAGEYVKENASVAKYMVTDLVRGAETDSLDDVGAGEGKIVNVDGRKLAVFRDARGGLHARSPVCPHLGCHVHFNNAEKTWDCPCHGSRFDTDGKVLHGPSLSGLAPAEIGVPTPEPVVAEIVAGTDGKTVTA